jgi:hypothetical protein
MCISRTMPALTQTAKALRPHGAETRLKAHRGRQSWAAAMEKVRVTRASHSSPPRRPTVLRKCARPSTPFSESVSTCPGRGIAMAELRLAAAAVARHHRNGRTPGLASMSRSLYESALIFRSKDPPLLAKSTSPHFIPIKLPTSAHFLLLLHLPEPKGLLLPLSINGSASFTTLDESVESTPDSGT